MRCGILLFHPFLLDREATHSDEEDYGPDIYGELHGKPDLMLDALGGDTAPLLVAAIYARGYGEKRQLWTRGEGRRVVGEVADGRFGGAWTDKEVTEELLAEGEAGAHLGAIGR